MGLCPPDMVPRRIGWDASSKQDLSERNRKCQENEGYGRQRRRRCGPYTSSQWLASQPARQTDRPTSYAALNLCVLREGATRNPFGSHHGSLIQYDLSWIAHVWSMSRHEVRLSFVKGVIVSGLQLADHGSWICAGRPPFSSAQATRAFLRRRECDGGAPETTPTVSAQRIHRVMGLSCIPRPRQLKTHSSAASHTVTGCKHVPVIQEPSSGDDIDQYAVRGYVPMQQTC